MKNWFTVYPLTGSTTAILIIAYQHFICGSSFLNIITFSCYFPHATLCTTKRAYIRFERVPLGFGGSLFAAACSLYCTIFSLAFFTTCAEYEKYPPMKLYIARTCKQNINAILHISYISARHFGIRRSERYIHLWRYGWCASKKRYRTPYER